MKIDPLINAVRMVTCQFSTRSVYLNNLFYHIWAYSFSKYQMRLLFCYMKNRLGKYRVSPRKPTSFIVISQAKLVLVGDAYG